MFFAFANGAYAKHGYRFCHNDDRSNWRTCIPNVSGSEYFGERKKDGTVTGYGLRIFNDKSRYIGEFSTSYRHGQGTLFNKYGKKISEGIWKVGKLQNAKKGHPNLKNYFERRPISDRKQIQSTLKALGLYFGSIDGIWGPNTQKAILAYADSKMLSVSNASMLFEIILTPEITSPQPEKACDEAIALINQKIRSNSDAQKETYANRDTELKEILRYYEAAKARINSSGSWGKNTQIKREKEWYEKSKEKIYMKGGKWEVWIRSLNFKLEELLEQKNAYLLAKSEHRKCKTTSTKVTVKKLADEPLNDKQRKPLVQKTDVSICSEATYSFNGQIRWITQPSFYLQYVKEAKGRGLSCGVGTQTATIASGASTLPKCVGSLSTWTNCYGNYTYSNGNKYVGEFKVGKHHGEGSLSFVNGANYIGQFEGGKFHGKGTFTHLSGSTYVGDYNKGMLEGLGIFTWINGDRYVGQYKNGKKDGLGTLTWKSGGKFVGQYKADLINGQGEESFPNGNKYVGEYKNGEFDGQGIFTWINGDRYVGQYKNGKQDGLGSLFYIDGGNYIGRYKNGKQDGSGEEVSPDGNKYVGEYKNGEFDGQGTFIWINGDRYVGQYKNGLRNGQGSSSWANGDTYVGQQKNGKFHGRGTYTWPNGGKYVGEYKDGLQEGTGEETFPNGDKYLGEYKKAKFHGQGTLINIDGRVQMGTWNNGKFEKVVTSLKIKPQLVSTQTKVALLIGNSKYEYAKDLRNPSNDVSLLKEKLLGLGFSVDTLLDGERASMTEAILEFGRNAQNSDISLLFYAGHSVEAQGLNYLIPTDAEILSENGLEPKAVPLDWVLKQIKLTKTLSIALLDSCRDNPFADRMYKTKSRSTASRGLAKVKVEGNQFIGFSAAPGQVASDGVGSNSPYTNALVKYISAQDEINYMFRKIKTEVQTITSGIQVPYVENNLGAELIYLHK